MPDFSMKQGTLFPIFDLDEKEKAILGRFLALLDRSGVSRILPEKSYGDCFSGGRPGHDQASLFAAVLLGFALGNATLRELEAACRFDLRFKFILDGAEPSHMAFQRILDEVFLPNVDLVFFSVTKAILAECGLGWDDAFVDGTKQEADANKFKFVWKPTTNHLKLSDKCRAICERNGISGGVPAKGILRSMTLAAKLSELAGKVRESGEDPGALYRAKGHRNSGLAKDYMLLSELLSKALEYEESEAICGSRNSYYKTDVDATAMCLKADYYSGLGSSMHAAYSEQISVSHGIVTCFYVGQERQDSSAFSALFERMVSNGMKPKSLCADAGYGCKAVYSLLEGSGVEAYVKYPDWEGELSGRRPASYRREGGSVECLCGRPLVRVAVEGRHPKRAGGAFYKCEDCRGCPFMHYCRRFKSEPEGDSRVFEIDAEWLRLKEEARDRLLSPKGIEMRVNRSCQVEGAFGMIKQDMGYVRFRRTSLEKARLEFMLYCLGLNIRKLFRFYGKKARFEYWKSPEGLKAESFKKPSVKRIENRMAKRWSKAKQPNEKAKKEYRYAGRKKGRNPTS